MSEREEAWKEAWKLPFVELVETILSGEYTPGIEDDVLRDRARIVDDAS